MTDIDVLVLGGSGVDTIVRVPTLPLPYADSYPVPTIVARAGQTGDGVALGLFALGLRTTLLDLLGNDYEGELVRNLYERSGVTLVAVPTVAGTKRAVNLVDPGGRRLSLYDTGRSLPSDRLPGDVVASLARAARHVHVSITHPCQYALKHLTGADVTVSTDLHDWDGSDPYHAEFARQADIVFLSATALTDREATTREIMRAGRARAVVVTAGARGSYLLDGKDAGSRWFPPAPLPAPATDGNGAGDAFAAGFLRGYLSRAPLDTCMRYGAVAGAHACTLPADTVDPIDHDELTRRCACWAAAG